MAQVEQKDVGSDPLAFLNALYNETVAAFGEPIGFNLFNVQLSGNLSLSWLLQQTNDFADIGEVERLVELGVIRTWKDRNGTPGFIFYTPQQIKTFKALQSLGRFADEELRHIMLTWDEDIECTLEVVSYDDLEASDLDAYRERILEHIEETKQQLSYRHEYAKPETEPDEQLLHLNYELQQYERVAQRIDTWTEDTLTPERRDKVARSLFRMRWIDEHIRLGNAEKYRAAITQGYSPDIFFSGYGQRGNEYTFERINWQLTMENFQRRIASGKRFPLRTPAFNLTEEGLLLTSHPCPDDYQKIYKHYRFDELREEISKLGTTLWSPKTSARNIAPCAGCGESFERVQAAKRYCSERCRSRAKQKRCRERDPERARLAQMRYWKAYKGDAGEDELTV